MSSFEQITDEELMKRLQVGERDCFEVLYERYRVRLFNYLLRLSKDSEQAEDFLHDCFIKVIESPGKFNAQLRFSTWIYTIATNLYRNEIRNRETRRNILQKNFVPSKTNCDYQPNQIDQLNFKKQLNEFVDGMSEENKTIYLLRFQEELSVPEISKIVDLPEGTVKSRLFYLMKKMAAELKAYNPAG